ncbi:PQQ-binding-like beta-propeller repeat protein [Gramella sp. MAR_2010_147]|uniref:outer membrane protein assembly factor BamB family protein n=1 Tax=Gramella sp. MAR_2010_147 TaxID=1250205 RepID=UPI00087AF3A3|nr:PQQ-binding-like beta-propeller repeat protein [Gramella sp. MAR_2010_147]SDS36276.1 Outer membrane protein assembly factor BamB, contains PQQ-like beta-propeller repeat [Gramella sp. MAR_2010_147]
MKTSYTSALLFIIFSLSTLSAQNFKFAQITDTHIGTETAKEDLERTVEDINTQDLDFVIVTGDITEMGTDDELALAKEILSKIEIPYYVVPGNHDTGWSESGGVSFIKEFGYDKFVFEHEGYKIIGCASGPYVRMSDGHIPRDAIVWLDSVLTSTSKDQRIIFANHYPIDNSFDNWYEVTERLKQYNTQFAICGHGHRNKSMNFEGIPASMGRSNLRAKDSIGGYSIISVTKDKALFNERIPGVKTLEAWRNIYLGKRSYDMEKEDFKRPSYKINDSFPQVSKKWSYHSNANVISTPSSIQNVIVFGNSTGTVEALSKDTGEKLWEYSTKGGIFSSPAAYRNSVILASGDGNIYSLNSENGKLLWKTKTGASVLGSPIIENDIVYIGGSDGNFRALNAATGKELWKFEGLKGPVVSKALIYDSKVIFGAWDKFLYALNKNTGRLEWKWSNDSPNRMFSPAMVIPVAANDAIYIVAPDRYISAINAENGKTLWRSNEATVRESLGISNDKEFLYAKTMNDTLVAFKTTRKSPEIAWKLDMNYGYDHVPSMIIEKNKTLYFGGRNGIVFSVDPKSCKQKWSYKIDNSMINTVNVINDHQLVAATMDGKIVLLEWKP